MEHLLSNLNEPQSEAVMHCDGPLLILAGPGSGKTRVITRRAAHLAETVTTAHRILAVTFTNKAAKEMRKRVEALALGDGMTIATFHALGARLLRIHHERAGIARDFTIFDTDDRRKLIKRAVEMCDLSPSNWQPAAIEREISLAKGSLITPSQMAGRETDWRLRTIARVYQAYEKLLHDMNGLDFDDLLMRVALLLERDEDLRNELEARYRYVLIDEYQDTNAAQYRIAHLLTRDHKNLCATGDPDQSIYAWRGADVGNILRFEQDYPEAKVVYLEQNYRSTKRILAAADALIAGNAERKEKTLWTANDEGAAVRVREAERGEDEADELAADLQQLAGDGTNLDGVAVFYRVNSLSRVIEEALIRRGVPYQIVRGVEFYKRKEIKDVIGYLRVLVNPSDDVALLRIINTPPRGIGATTVTRLREAGEASDRRLLEAARCDDIVSGLGRSASKLRQFVELVDGLKKALEMPPQKAIEFVTSHSGLYAHYRGQQDADGGPLANLDELVSAAAEFQTEHPGVTIRDWLEHTALVSDIDGLRSEQGAVTLMTLHAAKGLEFPIVYIVGLEEGLLPMQRRDDGDTDMEEERRLLFVGMTRAEQHLTLTHARYRTLRGMTQRTVRSPFLDELPSDAIEWIGDIGATDGQGSEAGSKASQALPPDIELWEVGTLVRHPAFGLGQIMSMHGGPRRTHVDVQFKDGPRRSWVLEFAPLQRVDFHEVE